MVDVGTTNRTRLSDYVLAAERVADLAAILKVHTSNFRVEGFTESVDVARDLGEVASSLSGARTGPTTFSG